MPTEVPILPAYGAAVPRPAFNDKKQTLVYSKGCAVDALDLLKGGSGNPLSLPYLPQQPGGSCSAQQQEPVRLDSKLPKWIANDRKVLRWFGHFDEAVPLSAVETYRIRHVICHYYTCNDTMEVVEPKEENSGIPQGIFVKRHRIGRPDSTGEQAFYQPQDLLVGGQITVYGRRYSITGADAFTRAYMQQQLGITLAPDQQSPHSPYNPKHVPGNALRLASMASTASTASSGRSVSLKTFLEDSNKVLRFFCVWDDRSSQFGDRRRYRLHFYVEDATCEIMEDRSAASRSPVFLRRGPLPKHAAPPQPGFVPDRSECFGPADFRMGATISVFGRAFLIYGCDDFTRTWLQTKLGWTAAETAPLDVSEPVNLPHPRQLPLHNGFGSEEDSSSNCMHLVPKPPRKMLSQEDAVLRFTCCLCNDGAARLAPTDLERRFVLSCFPGDDTLALFEPPLKNSGFVGGRFLDRRQVCWPGSPAKPIRWTDLHVGAVLPICQRRFELLEADAHTYSWLEGRPTEFPHADAGAALTSCTAALQAGGATGFKGQLAAADADGCGHLTLGQLTAALQALQPQLSRHQAVSIFRSLPRDASGRASIAALMQALGV